MYINHWNKKVEPPRGSHGEAKTGMANKHNMQKKLDPYSRVALEGGMVLPQPGTLLNVIWVVYSKHILRV